MLKLRPEFMQNANPAVTVQAAGNDSCSSADDRGALTLEMRDNPFASFMRKLERLIDLDPKEAFRMAQTALTDRFFEGDLEERLRLKLDHLIDLVHKQEQKPDISGPFARSALHLVVPAPVSQPFAVVPMRAFSR